MSDAPVVVLGDVMTDVVARIAEPLAVASDTPARIAMRPAGRRPTPPPGWGAWACRW